MGKYIVNIDEEDLLSRIRPTGIKKEDFGRIGRYNCLASSDRGVLIIYAGVISLLLFVHPPHVEARESTFEIFWRAGLDRPLVHIQLTIHTVTFKYLRVAIACSAFCFFICRCTLSRTMQNDGNRNVPTKKIIISEDSSANSEKGLDCSIRLAKASGAEIEIIHAIRHIELTKIVCNEPLLPKHHSRHRNYTKI